MTMDDTGLPILDFSPIGPRVGDSFPDIVLPDQGGNLVDLHASRAGRRALVVFFRSAGWCPWCKTQLVELQQSAADFEREGVYLVAVSYDAVETLSAFTDKRGITFPLLSDERSKAITALGLLNEHLDEYAAYFGVRANPNHYGIPYPGSFVLDRRGVVVDKWFEIHQRFRPSPVAQLEKSFAGSSSRPSVRAQGNVGDVTIVAALGQSTYRPYQKLRLDVTVRLPRDRHAGPTPGGQAALAIDLEPMEGLVAGPVELLPAHTLLPEGLAGDRHGSAGEVRGALTFWLDRNAGDVVLRARVGYPGCTAGEGVPVVEATLELPLAGLDLVRDVG